MCVCVCVCLCACAAGMMLTKRELWGGGGKGWWLLVMVLFGVAACHWGIQEQSQAWEDGAGSDADVDGQLREACRHYAPLYAHSQTNKSMFANKAGCDLSSAAP